MGILLRRFAFVLAALWAALTAGAVWAQQGALVFNTIERPPFAYLENGQPTGFSIDLMRAVAEELGREIQFRWSDSFPQMLGAVEAGTVDGAVANISITSAREKVMDFSQPIFESGLQIMVMGGSGGASIWAAVFSYDLLLAVLAAFAALFVLGMLMWFFERRGEPYFDRSGREAMFPAFWWALNLVVNGGFEERLPRSIMGRLLGVIMVISSLFVVSIFVANITASLTVEAISGPIESLEDLDGRKVATTTGSTSSAFLEARNVPHLTHDSLAELISAFETGTLDAVVFDGPILAHYVTTQGWGEVAGSGLSARELRHRAAPGQCHARADQPRASGAERVRRIWATGRKVVRAHALRQGGPPGAFRGGVTKGPWSLHSAQNG